MPRSFAGVVEMQEGALAEVDHHPGQGLVQGRVGGAEADDPVALAQRLAQGLAEDDAGVLGEVVLVDLDVAPTAQLDREAGIARGLLEHVVEEGQAGVDLTGGAAIEAELAVKLGLAGHPLDPCPPGLHPPLRASSSRRERSCATSPSTWANSIPIGAIEAAVSAVSRTTEVHR